MSDIELNENPTTNSKADRSCRYCGRAPIAYNAKACPGCGGSNPAKRWWHPIVGLIFLPIFLFVGVMAIAVVFTVGRWLFG